MGGMDWLHLLKTHTIVSLCYLIVIAYVDELINILEKRSNFGQ